MAKNRRLTPSQLAEEKSYFTNLKNIEDYAPINSAYAVAAIQPIVDRVDAALEREARLSAEIAEVRDIIAEGCTQFVEKNDGSVIQVAAQYGEDSPQIQSLGRKRKSERSTSRKRKNGGTATTG